MTNWVDHTLWWHVYPLGFTGAPVRPSSDAERAPTPRLDRLEPWFDHLISLGANGLALGPVFASETHGYDTTDFFRIDPRLGDDAAFDRLVEACRSRGVRILLDGVFNHVGETHPAFVEARAGGASRELFRFRADGEHEDFEGHHGLVALDHSSPAVADLVVDVMTHWLGRGADGWRLDAAYAVPPEFWTRVLPRVRERFPDAWFVGEVIHGDYAAVVAESGLDSVTQYELWKAIWSSIRDGNFHELDWNLRRHDGFLESFTPLTFVGNHDVTRIATQVGQDGAVLAATVLFTVGGVPSVYYGDESGYTGTKTERLGGDDEVRPPFPDSPADLSPLGEGMLRVYRELVGVRRRNPWLVRAHTTALRVDNRVYEYESCGPGGESLRVLLTLDPTPAAEVTEQGDDGPRTIRLDLPAAG